MKGCLRLRLRTIGVVGDESDYVVGQNLRLARLFGPLTKNYWCEDILIRSRTGGSLEYSSDFPELRLLFKSPS
jgi:hypothetical protein